MGEGIADPDVQDLGQVLRVVAWIPGEEPFQHFLEPLTSAHPVRLRPVGWPISLVEQDREPADQVADRGGGGEVSALRNLWTIAGGARLLEQWQAHQRPKITELERNERHK